MLERYEYFMNFVEWLFDEKIPDNIRNKNRNIFHTFCRVWEEVHLIRELTKRYTITWPFWWTLAPSALLKRKKEILVGDMFMFPIVEEGEDEGGLVLKKVLFLQRKDKIWPFIEKVKDWAWGILWGQKETEATN